MGKLFTQAGRKLLANSLLLLLSAQISQPALATGGEDSSTNLEPTPPQVQDKLAETNQTQALRLSGSAAVSPEESEQHIENLTRQILLKIIEMEKYNLHYTMEVARQGRWKGWRYTFFGESNAGLGLAGGIISTAYRGARIHHAARVHPALQENANFIPMIGNVLGGSAAAMEFGINTYHDIQAGRRGYSPKAAVAKIKGLRDEIDQLMARRDTMIDSERLEPTLSAHVQINEAEGRVLRDLEFQTLQEFERFHVGARRTLAFQQSQYFFDLAKNTTNAIGYEFAYLSLHRHHRVWNGRAGAMWDVTAPLFMFGPVLSRATGAGVGALTRRSLNTTMKDARTNSIKNLEADLASLNELVQQSRVEPDPVLKALGRTGMYEDHSRQFSQELSAALKTSDKAKLIATQNIGAGMFVGGSKLASGILFSIAGFNHHYNGKGERADRVTNDLLFSASVVSLPATMFNILDTMRIQVKGEINRQRAIKAGTSPGQLVAGRLKQLDELESKLKAL